MRQLKELQQRAREAEEEKAGQLQAAERSSRPCAAARWRWRWRPVTPRRSSWLPPGRRAPGQARRKLPRSTGGSWRRRSAKPKIM